MGFTPGRVRRGALGACVAGALGFGATQALATPQPVRTAQVCDSATCDRLCRLAGNNGGTCSSRGLCVCLR